MFLSAILIALRRREASLSQGPCILKTRHRSQEKVSVPELTGGQTEEVAQGSGRGRVQQEGIVLHAFAILRGGGWHGNSSPKISEMPAL
eukprot:scaffold1254_cov251-Pinguiococcus_pyrenoidosus.AAC.12